MHRSTWISALLVASGLTIAGFASAGGADRGPPGPRPAQDDRRGGPSRGPCGSDAEEARSAPGRGAGGVSLTP